MEQIASLIEILAKNLKILKKSPNRKYQRSTLIEKLHSSRCIYEQILDLGETIEDDLQQLESATFLYEEIKKFIDVRLERDYLISFKTLAKVALRLVQLYKKNGRAKSRHKTRNSASSSL